ncbi:multidrug ABC transporter ATP-binding protein [Mycoplasmopsis bovirhinis]|nr:multidrug ABC transporter ATP-binding protein [Mycoplasmopsis bovirhinis]
MIKKEFMNVSALEMDTNMNTKPKIKIWHFTKGLRFLILLTIIFIGGQIFLEVMTPRYVQNIINVISLDKWESNLTRQQAIYHNAGYLFLFILLTLVISVFVQIFLISKISTEFSINIKNKLFEQIQNFSPQDLNHYSVGTVLNRLNNDVGSMERTLSLSVTSIVRSVFMFSSALYFSLNESRQLSYVFLISIPICFVMFGIIFVVRKTVKKLFRYNDEFNQKLQENLHSIKTIKANVTEEYEYQKIKQHTAKLTKSNLKIVLANSLGESAFMSVIYISLILLATIGVNLFLEDKIDVGHIVLFGTYIWMITASFLGILHISYNIFIAIPSSKRLKEILNHEVKITNIPNAIKDFEIQKIEFKNVSFKYDKNPQNTLSNLNFVIDKNTSLGIIGQTGEGKSTLVNLLARFYDVTEGEILINDINIKQYDLDTLRQKISIVFQENILFSGTIRSNFKLVKHDANDQEIYQVLQKAQIYDFIYNSPDQLETKVNQKGSNFSGGQRQRLAIARALIKDPNLLILDDATSALDFKTEQQVKDTLRQINHSIKIIISQKINSIKDCNKIIVLERGKIASIGKHQDLLKTSELYHKIYKYQNSILESF